jgi:hypothetical protein
MSHVSSASFHCPETPEAPPPTAGDNTGRDANGRFVAGNRGGPGNPFARRIAEFRKAIVEAATPQKVAAVVAKLEEKALEGDVAAAKLYLAYAIGKPGPMPDPDRLDVEEGRLVQQEMELFRLMAQAIFYPLLETGLDMVRTGRPAASDKFVKRMVDGIAAIDAAKQAPPSANEDNGEVPSPAVMPPPSGNGDNGPDPAGAGQGPREGMGSPGGAAPTGNGGNGDAGGRKPARGDPQPPPRRPGRWVPPWEDGWGNAP